MLEIETCDYFRKRKRNKKLKKLARDITLGLIFSTFVIYGTVAVLIGIMQEDTRQLCQTMKEYHQDYTQNERANCELVGIKFQ